MMLSKSTISIWPASKRRPETGVKGKRGRKRDEGEQKVANRFQSAPPKELRSKDKTEPKNLLNAEPRRMEAEKAISNRYTPTYV